MADYSVTAANVRGFGSHLQGTLGGTVTQGQAVRKQANGTFVVATNASLAGSKAEGVALTGGSSGQPFTYQKGGLLTTGATGMKVGKVVVLSEDGAMSPVDDVASSDYVTVMGVTVSATQMMQAIIQSGVAADEAVS